MAYRFSAIKSLQYVTVTITTGGSATATITAVDPNNSIIILGGYTGSSTWNNPGQSALRLELTNSTTVTASNLLGGGIASTVLCIVVEFAPGVLLSHVQRGTITIANGSASNTATISAVGSHGIVSCVGWATAADGTQAGGIPCNLALTNATTITATRGASPAVSMTVGYEVWEPK